MHYQPLPIETRNNGKPRRVGFELEFTGINFELAAKTLQDSIDGELEKTSEVEWRITSPDLGKFNIELDWSALKELAGEQSARNKWIELLRDSAAYLVPLEVVFPPLTEDQLQHCDRIVEALRQAGARGTEDSPIAAYGVHINTELPDLELDTILNYLRAFALLQWWLVTAHEVDMARRISPYVDLFPEKYVHDLLSHTPADMNSLIDDYLANNATRNRAFDMLPVFSVIDPQRIKQTIDDDRINARETFHYRLPNCEIDQQGWFLSKAWNIWLVVEHLANDKQALTELGEQFLQRKRPFLGVNRTKWVNYLEQWIPNQEWE